MYNLYIIVNKLIYDIYIYIYSSASRLRPSHYCGLRYLKLTYKYINK